MERATARTISHDSTGERTAWGNGEDRRKALGKVRRGMPASSAAEEGGDRDEDMKRRRRAKGREAAIFKYLHMC